MIKHKRIVALVLSFVCISILSSCGVSSQSDLPVFSQIEPYVSEISGADLLCNGIVALGEATHGNRESDTIYLRARSYDPGTGRFVGEDFVRGVARKLPNGQEMPDSLSLHRYK